MKKLKVLPTQVGLACGKMSNKKSLINNSVNKNPHVVDDRGCGRTDFQEGNSNTMYDSVWNQILTLPDNFKLYPAHDYKGRTETSVAEEKSLNPR